MLSEVNNWMAVTSKHTSTSMLWLASWKGIRGRDKRGLTRKYRAFKGCFHFFCTAMCLGIFWLWLSDHKFKVQVQPLSSFLFSWHVFGSKEGPFFFVFFSWYPQSWSSSPQPICWHLLSLSVEVITKGTKGVNPITQFCSETSKRKQSYTSEIMSNINSYVVLTRCLSTSTL